MTTPGTPQDADYDSIFLRSFKYLLGALCIRQSDELAADIIARLAARTAGLTDDEAADLLLELLRGALTKMLDNTRLRDELRARIPDARRMLAGTQTRDELAKAIRAFGVRLQGRTR